MSLPNDILVARLRNELSACSRYVKNEVDLSEPKSVKFPIEIEISMVKVPGPVLDGIKVTRRYNHQFVIIISANYPFEKPSVAWKTPIFHPNIMMPEDGGHLCTKLLQDWSFNSTIISFIKGVESLLASPNPESPFGTDSCTSAAQYFNLGEGKTLPTVCPGKIKGVKIV